MRQTPVSSFTATGVCSVATVADKRIDFERTIAGSKGNRVDNLIHSTINGS